MTIAPRLDVPALQAQADQIRISIIEMLAAAKSGHSAGPLGMAEILTVLYFNVMKHDPADPEWAGRDVFFLSNGHTAPVLYASLAHSGYFPVEELTTLRQYGSRLQGTPSAPRSPASRTRAARSAAGCRRRPVTRTCCRTSTTSCTASPTSPWATAS